MSGNNKLLVFGSAGCEEIAAQIARRIGDDCLGEAIFSEFRSGQIKWTLPESVRGAECWVIQFFNRARSDDLVRQFYEAKMLLRTLKDCHAQSWNLAMPLLPDTRQDQQWGREPYSLAQHAKELKELGVSEVITYDLHNPATAALFDGSCTHLFTSFIFLPMLEAAFQSFDVVASTDTGSAKMAEWYSRRFPRCEVAMMYKGAKRGTMTREIAEHKLAGDVSGKKILVVDELCDSGGTLVSAVNFLIDEKGASQVIIVIPHTTGTGDCQQKLAQLCERPEILGYWTTDSVWQPAGFYESIPRATIVDLGPHLAEAIGNIHNHESVQGSYRLTP